jgi:hypothetical protein
MPPENSLNSIPSEPTSAMADHREGDLDRNKGDNKNSGGLFLRWSRITKSVAIKPESSGLLRSSIAAPTAQSREDFRTAMRRMSTERKNGERLRKPVKTIINEVSGYAAPGEILAMMG